MPSTLRLTMFSMILFCSAISVSVTVPSHFRLTPRSWAALRAPLATVSQNSPPVLLGMAASVSFLSAAGAVNVGSASARIVAAVNKVRIEVGAGWNDFQQCSANREKVRLTDECFIAQNSGALNFAWQILSPVRIPPPGADFVWQG